MLSHKRILTRAELDDVTVSSEVFEVAFDGGSTEAWTQFKNISLREFAELVVDSVLNGVERCRADNLNLLVEINI